MGTHEHSRVHFSILRFRTQFRAATRKERPCFAAERGLDRRGHTWTLEALEQPHEKNGPVLLQNVAPTPLGTHEHSRIHFRILRLRTSNQGVPNGLEQPHEKKGGDLEIGTWPKPKCTFYEQNLVLQNQTVEQPHEKNGPVLLQNVAPTFGHTRALAGPFFSGLGSSLILK